MQQYYDIFRQNGLVSLDKVEGIKEKYQLKQIGINKVAHQCLIMAQIRKLSMKRDNDNHSDSKVCIDFFYII